MTSTSETGSYKDGGKMAQKRLSGKPAFHQNEKVFLELWLERYLFTTADHAQWNLRLTAPVQKILAKSWVSQLFRETYKVLKVVK